LLLAMGVLGLSADACSGSPVGEEPPVLEEHSGGCRHIIRGVIGLTKPENSRLSCSDIHKLVFGLPSEPQAYVIIGEAPRLLWTCRYFGIGARRVLLRCQHHAWHFSVVKYEVGVG